MSATELAALAQGISCSLCKGISAARGALVNVISVLAKAPLQMHRRAAGGLLSIPLQSCLKVFAGLLQGQDPQEAGLQVQLTPTIPGIPGQGRLKGVCAGIEAKDRRI